MYGRARLDPLPQETLAAVRAIGTVRLRPGDLVGRCPKDFPHDGSVVPAPGHDLEAAAREDGCDAGEEVRGVARHVGIDRVCLQCRGPGAPRDVRCRVDEGGLSRPGGGASGARRSRGPTRPAGRRRVRGGVRGPARPGRLGGRAGTTRRRGRRRTRAARSGVRMPPGCGGRACFPRAGVRGTGDPAASTCTSIRSRPRPGRRDPPKPATFRMSAAARWVAPHRLTLARPNQSATTGPRSCRSRSPTCPRRSRPLRQSHRCAFQNDTAMPITGGLRRCRIRVNQLPIRDRAYLRASSTRPASVSCAVPELFTLAVSWCFCFDGEDRRHAGSDAVHERGSGVGLVVDGGAQRRGVGGRGNGAPSRGRRPAPSVRAAKVVVAGPGGALGAGSGAAATVVASPDRGPRGSALGRRCLQSRRSRGAGSRQR